MQNASPARHAAQAQTSAPQQPALLEQLLRGLRDGVDGVDGGAAASHFAGPRPLGPVEPPRPFLSVVTRTQGRRPGTLRDALLALSAQTCGDFELIVVGHRLDEPALLRVERILGDSPPALRARIRLIRVEHGNRTAPLNAGFEAARGDYVAILDDDDVPLAHWVATFRDLARQSPGAVLRAVAVKQEGDEVRVRAGAVAVRATGAFLSDYPVRFDLLQHLRINLSPPIALAFPRAVLQELGIRFDETLGTNEDWDFLMRAASVCGVACAEEVTGIYRWWRGAESSRSVHGEQEWRGNHERIVRRLDRMPLLLPPGSGKRLRELINQLDWQQAELDALRCRRGLAGTVDPGKPQQVELAALLRSTSWRLTAPLRRLRGALGGRAAVPRYNLDAMSDEDVAQAIQRIRRSRSWRFTAPMRRLSALFAGR